MSASELQMFSVIGPVQNPEEAVPNLSEHDKKPLWVCLSIYNKSEGVPLCRGVIAAVS